jgi:hypothetical protein
MRFRLTYEGSLKSSQPPYDKEGNLTKDKHWMHKHSIRKKLQPQLKRIWQTNQFLRFTKLSPGGGDTSVLPETSLAVQWGDANRRWPLDDALSECYVHHQEYGYKYVPLIWKDADLSCSLRILCLRLDHDNAVLPGRDIDNRIKTLIDALTMPLAIHGPPLEDKKPLLATDDEKPFYVLMDDDRRVSHLEVETDHLLADMPPSVDGSYVRLIITVETRSINTTMFNIGFS